MKSDKDITLLSTEATDILVSEEGKLLRTQKGGPALFISKVFNEKQIQFASITAEGLIVEILLTKNGEFGRVKNVAEPLDVQFDQIKTPILLISSIASEIDISNLNKYQGKVFLDVQGFVRDGTDFGKKNKWVPSVPVYCLKGTEEELSYLPKTYIQTQKKKILLVTRGKKGVIAYIEGKRYASQPEKVIQSEDTIGAGDSFFAYFVSNLINTKNAYISLSQAVEQTSKFLSSKFHHSQPL